MLPELFSPELDSIADEIQVVDLARYMDIVLLPEMNSGQLTRVLRAEYLVDVEGYSRVEGRPLFAAEIENAILERLS